ncbi:MAG: 50S ribosomal protein L21e [Candidatus Ranarchaeia archaeon]
MGKNPRGTRHATRNTFKKHIRDRGLAPLGKLLIKYSLNDRVDVIPDPSIQKTLPHRRFVGKVGTIVELRGRAYMVEIMDGNMKKTIILRKEHLRPHMEGKKRARRKS